MHSSDSTATITTACATSAAATADIAAWMKLPERVRDEVERWVRVLPAVVPPIGEALDRVAREMGVSTPTARRKYDAWRKGGRTWSALVDGRATVTVTGMVSQGLSSEFLAWWHSLVLTNGRKYRPAYREFVRQYFAGLPIPGMTEEELAHRAKLPRGYSYDNLWLNRPDDFTVRAARIGRSSASDLRPKIIRSRIGLAVGQRYIFDDMWHDFEVVVVGQRGARRLLQLHCHDLFSGCQFARGMKPRIKDPDTGKSVNLAADEMLFFAAHVLAVIGYHPNGVILMVELGTAAIPEWLESLLYDLSGGLVTVERTGSTNASAFAGQYPGSSKGNFRFKAALESLGNLIHNETAALLSFPGQTGSNARLNAPEELYGRERKADALARAIAQLPPQVASQLCHPFLEVTQAMHLVNEVMERINRRTDHDLADWIEAGLTTLDYEVPHLGIIPEDKVRCMAPEQRAALQAIATPVPRRMSPREAFDRGAGQMVRFRPEQVAAIFAKAQSRTVKVRGHLLEFEDQTISPSPLRYLAHHWQDGEEFSVVVNPFGPDRAWLYDARGRWIGTTEAWQSVSHMDTDGLHQQMGRAAGIERQLLSQVARGSARITQKRLDETKHNIGVLREHLKATGQLSVEADEALQDQFG